MRRYVETENFCIHLPWFVVALAAREGAGFRQG